VLLNINFGSFLIIGFIFCRIQCLHTHTHTHTYMYIYIYNLILKILHPKTAPVQFPLSFCMTYCFQFDFNLLFGGVSIFLFERLVGFSDSVLEMCLYHLILLFLNLSGNVFVFKFPPVPSFHSLILLVFSSVLIKSVISGAVSVYLCPCSCFCSVYLHDLIVSFQ
jgi:hypothetical protein